MTKYVAGLLFDDEGKSVALIHKNRGSDRICNKWNAIGGKVEPYEQPQYSMSREFSEEAGVLVNWRFFMNLSSVHWEIDFYSAFNSDLLSQVRTMEDEEVRIFDVKYALSINNIVSNLKWVIPMALNRHEDNVLFYRVKES